MGKLGSVLYVTELTRFKVLWQTYERLSLQHIIRHIYASCILLHRSPLIPYSTLVDTCTHCVPYYI